jgi:uncharacterized protein YhbP (UPF0306 family)
VIGEQLNSSFFSKLEGFINSESVLTVATADACGAWSAPVLYVADTSIEPFVLYFLSSENSRHIKSLPVGGGAAVSIYSDYDGDWQSICGLQIHATISLVESAQTSIVEALYFNRFPEVKKLIDNPVSEQEKRIGAAFAKSKFYSVSPSFIRFTNNGDSFAGRTEWHL